MNIDTLTDLGLTESQAKAYLLLVQEGSIAPPELATKTKQTRTNAYKVLERLAELKLATKQEASNKITFRAANPIALEELARKRRNEVLDEEKRVRLAMPALLNYFYTYSEQPGIRFFQGKYGIKEIFDDMLRTRKTIYLIRSVHDVKFYDKEFFQEFIKKKVRLGIKTVGLTPDLPQANHNPAIDTTNNFSRTWMPTDAYTGAAEWYVYGNKLAILSYGEEAIGMIIESPQIADSFRQLFCLLQSSQSNSSR